MKTYRVLCWLVLVSGIAVAGCGAPAREKPVVATQSAPAPATQAAATEPAAPSAEEEAAFAASIAKLDPADRKIALEQKFCAVETENRLGSMGTPVKVVLKDQTVFVCCKGCVKDAQKEPDKVLAQAKELKEKTAAEKK